MRLRTGSDGFTAMTNGAFDSWAIHWKSSIGLYGGLAREIGAATAVDPVAIMTWLPSFGARRKFSATVSSTGAGLVLHHHRTVQFLAQTVGQDAGEQIAGPARGKADEHVDGALLGPRAERHCQRGGACRGGTQKEAARD